jgi:hypothetical protein
MRKKAWFPLPWEEIFPGRRTMPIEDFMISVFVGRRYPEGSVWVLQAVADPGAGPPLGG